MSIDKFSVSGPEDLAVQLSRRKLLKQALVGGVALSAMPLLVACGGDDGGEGGGDNESSGGGSSDSDEDADASDDESSEDSGDSGSGDSSGDEGGEPASGGTIVFAHNRDPDSLDPQKVTAVIAADWQYKIYDTLVTVPYDDLASIQDGLAESWEVSEDGVTLTFQLKEGVKFHSGKDFTSADVKYTFERFVAEETASPNAHRVEGFDEIETPDDLTAIFHLGQPNNELLINMASGFGGILNQEAVEEHGADYGTLAVDGTGPWVLEEWLPREQATFARNEEYTWGPSWYENQGPAHAERLDIRIIAEATPRILELESGNVHIVPTVPESQASGVDENGDLELIQGETGSTTYLGMNMRKELMQDKDVRTAIMHTVDRQMIVDDILQGYAITAWGPVAPFIDGALENVEEHGYAYDPEKAKSILDEAGWTPGDDGVRQKDGQSLVIPIYGIDNDTNREIISIISSNFGQVGMQVESNLIEEAAVWARLAAGEHTIMLMNMPHNTPDEILMFYFYSENQPAPNRFGFADEEVDEWLFAARETLDEDEWYELYANIQKRVLEEAFFMPLFHPYQLVGVHTPSISGYHYYGVYNIGSHQLLDVQVSE